MIAIPLLLLVVGYFTWSSAMDNYGYNIFNVWVFVRLLIAIALCFLDISLGIIVFSFFSIWSFFVTWRNTSFFIALLAVLLQPIALIFIYNALNSLVKALED